MTQVASYKKHCARCKEVTISNIRMKVDYIETYCSVCDGPSKRITYETAWNRITTSLAMSDDEPTEESPT